MKKTVFKIVAWLLVFAVLLGTMAGGIMLIMRAKSLAAETENVRKNAVAASSDDVTDGEGNKLVSGVTYALPRALAYSATSAESESASEGITVKASVLPENAANKNVDFSVAFQNAESEWATGKSAADYISVTTTQTPGKATLKCLAPFGEQIVLTATSVANREFTATCTIDFWQRVEYVKFGDMRIDFGQDNIVSLPKEGGNGGSFSCHYNSEIFTKCNKYLYASLKTNTGDEKYFSNVAFYCGMTPVIVNYSNMRKVENNQYSIDVDKIKDRSILFDRSLFQILGAEYYIPRFLNQPEEHLALWEMNDENFDYYLSEIKKFSGLGRVLFTLQVRAVYFNDTEEVFEADILWDRLIQSEE